MNSLALRPIATAPAPSVGPVRQAPFVGHSLIVGPTMCGKTAYAFELAKGWLARRTHVLVCDPLMSSWPCTWQTTCLETFVAIAKRSRRCALFIDEAGQTIGRDPAAEWLFTTARHWGHSVHVLSQGGVQLTPTMRAQCSMLSLFGSSPRVVEMFAEEFNDPALMAAVSLAQYQFLVKRRFQPVRGPLSVRLTETQQLQSYPLRAALK